MLPGLTSEGAFGRASDRRPSASGCALECTASPLRRRKVAWKTRQDVRFACPIQLMISYCSLPGDRLEASLVARRFEEDYDASSTSGFERVEFGDERPGGSSFGGAFHSVHGGGGDQDGVSQ